jgi:hypothetical protein
MQDAAYLCLMYRPLIGLLWSLILLSSECLAQPVKYANAFLDIGVSARSLGLSQAVVASTDDVSSAFWNPAGLTGMRRDIQLSFMHNEHFAGIVKFDYGGIALKFSDKDAGAFTFIRSGVDDIPNTLELIDANGNIDYDRVRSFSAADYAFMLSYARIIGKVKGLSLGGSVKLIHRSVGEFGQGWGFGIDFGAKLVRNKWMFGAMFRDASSTITNFNYNTETFRLIFAQTGNEVISSSTEVAVPRLNLGGAYKFSWDMGLTIQPELAVSITTDGRRNVLAGAGPFSFDPAFGTEFGFKDIVWLRGGIGRFQYLKTVLADGSLDGRELTLLPTAGLGFRIKAVNIDYTLANFGNSMVGMSHVFSIRLDLHKAGRNQSE